MKHAVVLGSTGVIGKAIARRLCATDDWQVTCVTRSGTAEPGARGVALDLLDSSAVRNAAQELPPITHVFFAAYQPRPSRVEEIEPNLTLLRNAIDLAEMRGRSLERVVLVTGGKYYGLQWGAIKTPATESDPRNLGPNFYYAQQDYLIERGTAVGWTWTNLIPPFVTGFSDRAPMNLVMVIGVLATLARELGQPLRFPGPELAWDSLHHVADADLIAAASAWAAASPNAGDQIFNVANGDPSRWRHVWPKVAAHFGLPCGDPIAVPLQQVASGSEALWRDIAHRECLRISDLNMLVDWNWASYMFNTAFANDVLLETGKIRRAGFHDCLDSDATLISRLAELQALRLIP